MPPNSKIRIINAKVIRLNGCPTSVKINEQVLVTAAIRLRLENNHTAPVTVRVLARIAVAGKVPAQFKELESISVAPGEMEAVEERTAGPDPFVFTTSGVETLEAVCEIQWTTDGIDESEQRLTACSFAVVEKPSDTFAGTRVHAYFR